MKHLLVEYHPCAGSDKPSWVVLPFTTLVILEKTDKINNTWVTVDGVRAWRVECANSAKFKQGLIKFLDMKYGLLVITVLEQQTVSKSYDLEVSRQSHSPAI
jgi:hypothetical protein